MDDIPILGDLQQELSEKTRTCRICTEKFFGNYAFMQHLEDFHPQEIVEEIQINCPEMTVCNNNITGTTVKTENDGSSNFSTFLPSVSKPRKKKKFQKKSTKSSRMDDDDDDEAFPEETLKIKTTPNNFTCQVCNEAFTRSYALKRHLEDLHPEELVKENQTNYSDLTFSNADIIIKTENSDSANFPVEAPAVPEKPNRKPRYENDALKCTVCDNVSPNITEFKVHITKHSGEKPWPCPFCPMSFARHTTVYEHVRIHKEDRPFKCSVCSFSFKRSGDLTVHMRKHAGERKHPCNICGKFFPRIADVNQHIKRVHDPEGKKFKCDICSTGNFSEYAAMKHRKVHLDGDKFRCFLCKITYDDIELLKSHLRKKHGEKKPNPRDVKFKVRKAYSVRHPRSRPNKSVTKCKKCLLSLESPAELSRHYLNKHNLPIVVVSRLKAEQ